MWFPAAGMEVGEPVDLPKGEKAEKRFFRYLWDGKQFIYQGEVIRRLTKFEDVVRPGGLM